MSQLFTSGDQSTGASASVSVLLMNTQGWFPLGLTGLKSLQSKGLSRFFSNMTVLKASILLVLSLLYVQLSHPYMTNGENIALTRQIFVGEEMSLLFNMLSRLSIYHEMMGAVIPTFWMLSFKPAFSLSSSNFIKMLFSSSSLCHKGGVICISEVIDISPDNLDSKLVPYPDQHLAWCTLHIS